MTLPRRQPLDPFGETNTAEGLMPSLRKRRLKSLNLAFETVLDINANVLDASVLQSADSIGPEGCVLIIRMPKTRL